MKKLTGIFLLIGLFVFLMPATLAATDVYSVEQLYFSDLSGTVLENPAQSCMVNVEVKKQKERTGNDDVIISSYATDGSLIGFTVVSGTINTGQTSTFRTLVEFPKDKTLGTVKAYVWDSFIGMRALSNTLTVEVNEMSGEITPPVTNGVKVYAEDYISVAYGGKDVDTDRKITFGTKNYNVNTASGRIYVNGVDYSAITEFDVAKVLGLAQGEVKLIDDDSTVSGYDKIMVTSYNIAKVEEVTYRNGMTTMYITTKAGLNYAYAIKITDDAIEDGYVALTVKNADDENVALSSIKKGDIIAFAINPYDTASTITDPDFIDIIVTDKKITGVVTRREDYEQTYTVGEEDYKEVVWGAPALTIGTEYSISLDPFGRIYEEEVIAAPTKYAIAEKYDSDSGLQLILPDGTAKWYEVDAIIVEDYGMLYNGTSATINLLQFETYIETTKKYKPAERVIKYTIKNSTGRIQSIELIGTPATAMTYKAVTERLGPKTITDRTAVIDASGYMGIVSEYAKFEISSFKNNTEYMAAVFTVDGSANKAAFIVLTDTGKTITEDSSFAVVRKPAAMAMTDDGDTCYNVNVLYKGKEQDLLFTTTSDATALNAGDAIFFVTDADGLVKSYVRVFNKANYASNNTAAFTSFGTTGAVMGTNSVVFTFDKTNWDYSIKNATNADYQLVYGIVTGFTGNRIEFAIETPANTIDLTNSENFASYGIDPDCTFYTYGINEQTAPANQYKAIVVDYPVPSIIDAYETGVNTGIYNLRLADMRGHDHLTYALALIIDGEIVELYSIVQ